MKNNLNKGIIISLVSILSLIIFYYLFMYSVGYFHSNMMNMNTVNNNKTISSEELIY